MRLNNKETSMRVGGEMFPISPLITGRMETLSAIAPTESNKMAARKTDYHYQPLDKTDLKKLANYYGFSFEENENFYRIRDRRTNLIAYSCVSPRQLQTYLDKQSWQG